MPLMLPSQGLLEPVDDASGVEQPPRFAEALEQVRAVIAPCDKAGIPSDTLIAALMTGLIPRLVQAYGSNGVAAVIGSVADLYEKYRQHEWVRADQGFISALADIPVGES